MHDPSFHRYLAVNRVLCRSETTDGAFAPGDVINTAAHALGEYGGMAMMPDKATPGTANTSTPFTLWSSDEDPLRKRCLVAYNEDTRGVRLVPDPVTAASSPQPAVQSNALVIDVIRRTAAAGSSPSSLYPKLRTVQSRRDPVRWHMKQNAKYLSGRFEELHPEGLLEIVDDTRVFHRHNTRRRLKEGEDVEEEGGSLLPTHHVGQYLAQFSGKTSKKPMQMICENESSADVLHSVLDVRCVLDAPMETSLAAAEQLWEEKKEHRARRRTESKPEVSSTADLANAMPIVSCVAQCGKGGSFATLLPYRDGACKASGRFRKSESVIVRVQALMNQIAFQHSAADIEVDAAGVRWSSLTAHDRSYFWLFVHYYRRIGVEVTPPWPTHSLEDEWSRETGKRMRNGKGCKTSSSIRSVSSTSRFSLRPLSCSEGIGPHGSPPIYREPSYDECVAAYRHLMREAESRRELISRLNALVRVDAVPRPTFDLSALNQHYSSEGALTQRITNSYLTPSSYQYEDPLAGARDAYVDECGIVLDSRTPFQNLHSLSPGNIVNHQVMDDFLQCLVHCCSNDDGGGPSSLQPSSCYAVSSGAVLSWLQHSGSELLRNAGMIGAEQELDAERLLVAATGPSTTPDDHTHAGVILPVLISSPAVPDTTLPRWIVMKLVVHEKQRRGVTSIKSLIHVYDPCGSAASDFHDRQTECIQIAQVLELMLKSSVTRALEAQTLTTEELRSHAKTLLDAEWCMRFEPIGQEVEVRGDGDSSLYCLGYLTRLIFPNVASAFVEKCTRQVVRHVLYAAPLELQPARMISLLHLDADPETETDGRHY